MSKDFGGIVKAWEKTLKKSQAAAKRRVNSIFATMSVAHVDDEDDVDANPGEVYNVDKVFSNGDRYKGQWADIRPYGHGKYLWTDGCMYVGEWQEGKINGKGKFSWPSGATYEGQFNNGYIDGEGTFTGCSNDSYRGSWVKNMKHGRGVKNYSNGDHYAGEWGHDFQTGQGRYQWHNGNEYIGRWRNGMMNGNGALVWANGNRYEGCWEDGLPKGNGTYRWPDGSFYVGVWSKDPREHSGTYYPSSSQMDGQFDFDPQEVLMIDSSECMVCCGEKILIFPSQKLVNQGYVERGLLQKQPECKTSKVSDVRLKRMSMEGRLSNDGGAYSWASDADGGGREDADLDYAARGTPIRIRQMRRPGETISKGHKNYDLMLNLQLGIRHAVGRPAPATSLDLRAKAFDTREKLWTRFPPEGSKHTPPHQSCDFKWKDYCPLVFRTLRKLFKVDPADYMISICGDDALRELSSPGKSGSFFYLTNDDKYMIKTMKKSEVKVLKRMLPAYYNHVRKFENTLVTKFFGLHCVKLTGPTQKKVRFVIMGNLFCTKYAIHRRFDLKGSSIGRTTDKPDSEIDGGTTLKDLDLNFIFRLPIFWFHEFCRQVNRDCDFLEHERIMDYSLLLGVHFRETIGTPKSEAHTSGHCTPTGTSEPDMDLLSDPTRWASFRLGMEMSASAELTMRSNDDESQLVGEPTGEYFDVILYFGIIDILQDYDISKKLEHAYKSIHYDPTSISAVDPRQYSRRFRDFIFKVFAAKS